jgi:DNA-binding Lrp family transcriptional regulator
MNELLELLSTNCKRTPAEFAAMLGKSEDEIKNLINLFEKDRTILGYMALIDWEKTESEKVRAFIELKVTPQQGQGFDSIAERIYQYKEVKTLWLMSGGFDFGLIVEGRTYKEVALFVAEKLAPMKQVVSTGTHFVLKTYKENGVIFASPHKDERSIVSL